MAHQNENNPENSNSFSYSPHVLSDLENQTNSPHKKAVQEQKSFGNIEEALPPAHTKAPESEVAVGGLERVGTFMGYPEFTLKADPVPIHDMGVMPPSNQTEQQSLTDKPIMPTVFEEKDDEITEFIQNEANGGKFYDMLSKKASQISHAETLQYLSQKCHELGLFLLNIRTQTGNVIMPEAKAIISDISLKNGVMLALKEESELLKLYKGCWRKEESLSSKEKLLDAYLEKTHVLSTLQILYLQLL